MKNMDGKESWKIRQEAIEKVQALISKKKRIINSKTIGDLLAILKDRLKETNLNLRAKVLHCIHSVILAIEDNRLQYASLIIPELMKLTNETKQNVIEGL